MSGFARVALGEVATLQAGVGFPLSLQGRSFGDYPLAKVGDISRVGRSGQSVLSAADHFVDKDDLPRLRASPIPAGSVLFAKIGEAIRQNHRVIAGCDLLIDNNAMAAIPTAKIESRYLYQFLRTVDFYGLTTSTTVPSLRKSELAEITLPLPPLSEQRRIVGILEKTDALRISRREAIVKLDQLLFSIFLEMFGDPEKNPKKYPEIKFGDVFEICSSKRVRESQWEKNGVPFYRAREIVKLARDGVVNNDLFISEELFRELSRVNGAPNPGDLMVSAVGTLGACYLVRSGDRFYFKDASVLRFIPREGAVSGFFQYAFGLDYILRQVHSGSGSTVGTYTIVRARETRFFNPPAGMQRQFSRFADEILRHRNKLLLDLEKMNSLFASVQKRAFSGEI